MYTLTHNNLDNSHYQKHTENYVEYAYVTLEGKRYKRKVKYTGNTEYVTINRRNYKLV